MDKKGLVMTYTIASKNNKSNKLKGHYFIGNSYDESPKRTQT